MAKFFSPAADVTCVKNDETLDHPVGVSLAAHRPKVFWPTPVLVIVCVFVIWATVVTAVLLQEGPRFNPTSVGVVSAAVAVTSLLLGLTRQARDRAYQNLLTHQASASSSWKKLKAATGIYVAVEGNIAFLRRTLNEAAQGRFWMKSSKVARADLAMLESLARRLRDVDPVVRPTDRVELKKWLKRRYVSVLQVNREVVLLGTRFECEMRSDADLRKDVIVKAFNEWEESVHALRLTAAGQGPLFELVERTETLVKYWLVLALNDPRYCNAEKSSVAQRKIAFDDADAAVKSLESAILNKSAGSPWWRVALLRSTLGQRGLSALDGQARRIH